MSRTGDMYPRYHTGVCLGRSRPDATKLASQIMSPIRGTHAISRLILETLIFSSTIMRICPLVVLKTHFHLHFGFFCIFKKSKETISSAKKHSFSYVFYSCNVKRVSVCAIPITKTCCFFLFFIFFIELPSYVV